MTVITERITLDPNNPKFELLEPSSQGELRPITVSVVGAEFTMNTYHVPRPGSGKMTILSQPWGMGVGAEADDIQRSMIKLISEETDSHVLAIDNPGVGHGTSNLSKAMFRTLMGGNFSGVADLMWQAVDQHPHFDVRNANELTLGWYSLGTSMASEMAAHAPEGIGVNRMFLLDTAASVERPFQELLRTFLTHGRDDTDRYLAETNSLRWSGMRRRTLGRYAFDIARQYTANVGYGVGLAKRSLGASLAEAYHRGTLTRDSEMLVINGSRSLVSRTADNDRLADRLDTLGMDVRRVILNGETHALGESFVRIAELMRRLGGVGLRYA